MKYLLIIVIGFFSSVNVFAQTPVMAGTDSAKSAMPEIIYYTSDTVKLKGYLVKPAGKGPFPVYMWNHDSEKEPVFNNSIANFWVKQGYLFFMPIRGGHSDNPGEYIVNNEKQINRRREMAQVVFKQVYIQHQQANKDVVSALKWIRHQSYTDSNRVVVAGAGYGGIQVLLTAEKDGKSPLGVKCFIAMAPASAIWYPLWGDSLVPAVSRAKRPIFIFQAHNDYKLGPCETLGPVLVKKGYPNRSKIFPDHLTGMEIDMGYQGSTDFFNDTKAWQKEVLRFLKDCKVVKARKKK